MNFRPLQEKRPLILRSLTTLIAAVFIYIPPALAGSFEKHLDALVPNLMADVGTPGAAIAVIENGSVVLMRGYGLADVETNEIISPGTVFNIGSISKIATAWGVQNLAAQGKVDLDVPIGSYIGVILGVDTETITLRHLLSHTAGLNLPAVPEYPSGGPVPSLKEALSELEPLEGVEVGEKYSYSGGGYMLIQYVIESVSGLTFPEFIKRTLFEPLQMTSSAFEWDPALLALAATPYDKGIRSEYFLYAGAAAASMNTSLEDISKWLVGWLSADPGVQELQSAQPNVIGNFGTEQGLGYPIWPLSNGNVLVGHDGQNTGWSATAWVIPAQKSGIVVLTNSSDGRDLWKWVLCDFIYWQAETIYRGMCDKRPEAAGSKPISIKQTLGARLKPVLAPYLAAIADGPGGVTVRVHADGQEILMAVSGFAEKEADRMVEGDTRFYLASVSKAMTSAGIMMLVEHGDITLATPLGQWLRDLPAVFHEVTVEEALAHRSGIPDYLTYVNFRANPVIDNDRVMKILAEHPEREFEAGSEYSYSNSNYVVLARLIEAVTGESFASWMYKNLFDPVEMNSTSVFDRESPIINNRAWGYRGPEGTPMDYMEFRLADGSTRPIGITTVGSGGIYSTAADLISFARAFLAGDLLTASSRADLLSPRSDLDPAAYWDVEDLGYALGWETGILRGRKVVGHNGGMMGHSTQLLLVPDEDIIVTVLANSSDFDATGLATEIVRILLWEEK